MVENKSSLASRIFSDSVVPLGILVGIILLWIASIVTIFITGTDARNVARALKYTGVALVSMMTIGGGVAITEKGRNIRIAMVVIGVIMLLFSSYAILGV